jgi:EAL domain-containing protein (putative c-di-GMP-specific phosphodiesterase class I)
MPDAAAEPLAAALPITQSVPIGAHMSVPLRLPNGQPYGLFCCLSFRPDQSLNDRDLQMMKVFADLAAYEINRNLVKKHAAEERQARIRPEHAPVDDYDRLLEALHPLRQRGLRLAVDDAGAGYSTLQHILCLRPDLIKLDMSLTRNIDTDTARRALAAALIRFARDTGSRIIAEGVETTSEMATLRSLGVEKAQGYFVSPPLPLDEAIAQFSTKNPEDLRSVA